ncbi:MAG: glucuronate isomerase [Chloroflexota bacterium]|nr:glucuronate isomerase [Chloroflexota bacterium]
MAQPATLNLPEDRYFDPEPAQKKIALELYRQTANLPLICPHGHVDPRVFADPDYSFGSPADLFIIPDHYVFRMLYSQGIRLEQLGVPAKDGTPVETDHRRIWQIFADHYYLFRGTPTGMWLNDELAAVFGIKHKLTSETAQAIYDEIEEKLAQPAFRPRALYERFNIETLTTTDPATSTLEHHQAIRDSGWKGRILPTFRPDAVVHIDTPGWIDHIDRLSEVSGIDAGDYAGYIRALEQRRQAFKRMGATATDHGPTSPQTLHLSQNEAQAIFARARRGEATPEDAARFTAHMLTEMARMSAEDGLVMQLHPGALRNHNESLYARFGPDMGADIPLATEYTRNLQTLLNLFGNNPDFTLILFTVDETTFSRELAPLAGHYPAIKLGPPWWFFDSWNGMTRYRQAVSETASLYNTAGFNDDTRAYVSIPARHDLARRVDANWLANLVVRSVIDMEDAVEMAHAAAYDLAKKAYKLD